MKLDFDSLALQGRDEEIALLRRQCDLVVDGGQTPKESSSEGVETKGGQDTAEIISQSRGGGGTCRTVFLYGYSGSGKTRLAYAALQDYVCNTAKGGCFVHGKYDQPNQRSSSSRQPYSAIRQICSEICDFVWREGKLGILDLGNAHVRLREVFAGEEYGSFRHAVPKISDLLVFPKKKNNNHTTTTPPPPLAEGSLVLEQLLQSFLMFFRIVGEELPLICCLLDDLQWADQPSMDILKRMQQDDRLKNLLWVFTYRENEVLLATEGSGYCSPSIKASIQDLEQHQNAVRIRVGDLSLENVNLVVANLLQRSHDPESTQELADVIFKKTNGNGFFTIQLLELLHQTEILKFGFQTLRWEWDRKKIQSETNSSDNVVDVVVQKIVKLPLNTILALRVAACLGSRFNGQILTFILQRWSQVKDLRQSWTTPTPTPTPTTNPPEAAIDCNNDDDHSPPAPGDSSSPTSSSSTCGLEVLQAAIDERLIDPIQHGQGGHSSYYKFSHDRIQQAAYALSEDDNQRQLLHLRIGKLLWKLYLDKEEQQRGGLGLGYDSSSSLLLVTVDQLRRSSRHIQDPETKVALSKLYLKASQHLRCESAFDQAADYLQQSIDLLNDDNKWTDQYDLSLELYTLAAQTEFTCGHYERCKSRSGEVLVNAKTIQDKLPVQQTLVNCYAAETRYDDAFDTAYDAATQAGEKLPTKPKSHHIMVELFQTKRALKKISDVDILDLPICTAPQERQQAWKILVDLVIVSWLANRENNMVMLILRMTRRTVTEGLTEMSASWIALYGFLMAGMNEISAGYRYGELAMQLQTILEKEFGDKARVYGAQTYEGVKHVLHIRKPIDQLLDINFRDIYKKGMETGSINWAFSGLADYIIVYFFAGLPLDVIINDSADFILELTNYKQPYYVYTSKVYRQCILNLSSSNNNGNSSGGDDSGKSKLVSLLGGEEVKNMGVETALSEERGKDFDMRHVQSTSFVQLILAYHFQDYDLAVKMADLHSSVDASEWPVFWCYMHPFYRALAYLAAYKEDKKKNKKLLKSATKNIQRVQWFCKNGMMNCVHLLSILKAERLSAVKGNDVNAVRAAYDKAIVSAGRSGNVRDGAIVSERAGIYFLGRADVDDNERKHYFSMAIKYYTEWGAKAMVQNIRTYSGLDEASAELSVPSRGSIRGAPRKLQVKRLR